MLLKLILVCRIFRTTSSSPCMARRSDSRSSMHRTSSSCIRLYAGRILDKSSRNNSGFNFCACHDRTLYCCELTLLGLKLSPSLDFTIKRSCDLSCVCVVCMRWRSSQSHMRRELPMPRNSPSYQVDTYILKNCVYRCSFPTYYL